MEKILEDTLIAKYFEDVAGSALLSHLYTLTCVFRELPKVVPSRIRNCPPIAFPWKILSRRLTVSMNKCDVFWREREHTEHTAVTVMAQWSVIAVSTLYGWVPAAQATHSFGMSWASRGGSGCGQCFQTSRHSGGCWVVPRVQPVCGGSGGRVGSLAAFHCGFVMHPNYSSSF